MSVSVTCTSDQLTTIHHDTISIIYNSHYYNNNYYYYYKKAVLSQGELRDAAVILIRIEVYNGIALFSA